MTKDNVQESTVQKERSMVLQKQLIGDYYDSLGRAREEGKRVVSTFVPGNLTELLRSFDLLPILPEINALQSGMRKLSANFIAEAEKQGHSEDVCTYVKCDIGMLKLGNVGPTGVKLPNPDLLLLSYTGSQSTSVTCDRKSPTLAASVISCSDRTAGVGQRRRHRRSQSGSWSPPANVITSASRKPRRESSACEQTNRSYRRPRVVSTRTTATLFRRAYGAASFDLI
jgi:hypothetical protein